MFISRLKNIIEGTDTRVGRLFDATVIFLVLVSLVTFTLDTLPELPEKVRSYFQALESVTVALFTIEYFLRILVADRKWRFALSFFGLIDLIAILPFYLAMFFGRFVGVDLRVVRIFRLLRVIRLLKLARYNSAVRRFRRAFSIAREELILFFCASLAVLYVAAVGIYYCERDAQPEQFGSVIHCLWWAVATLTTVGYGDVYPVTPTGRVLTFFVLMVGLAIVAAPAGVIASALARARAEELDDEDSAK